MQLIYISAAITKGDRNLNYYLAAQVHMALIRGGYAVVNPMATMTMPEAINLPWEDWLAVDETIISRCDAVLRLPHGESAGRDRECLFAEAIGIPVLAPSDFSCLSDIYGEAA